MSRSIVWRLIRKDLYLARPVMLGALVLGVAMLALTPFGMVAFYVGSVSFLCVLILLNVLLVSATVASEKKDRVVLFVLSLPISTTQYALAKMASSLIAFLVPFVLMAGATLALFDYTPMPNGLIPVIVVVVMYVFFYFCLFLGVALVADSGFWNTVVIIFGNVSINFVIAWAMRLPSVSETASGETAVWSHELVAALAIELVLSVVALGVSLYFTVRKKDFI